MAKANITDVNLYEGHLTLQVDEKRTRIIPIDETTARALKVYLTQVRPEVRHKPNERALLLNYAGRRLSRQCIWKSVKDAAHASGLPYTIAPSMLRTSRAIHLLTAGVDVQTVQELMGHADLSVTRIYVYAARAGAQPQVAA